MSLIKSYHQYPYLKPEREAEVPGGIASITQRITSEILSKHPGLVADVGQQRVERRILKKEIIRLLDVKAYTMDRDRLIREVFNYMFGYGQLQRFIEDEEISDIDGTRYNFFTVRRKGQLYQIPVTFGSPEEFEHFCKLLVIRNGGVINDNDNHARVTDENFRLRINVAVPPRNCTGPSLNIRKHRQRPLSLDQLQEQGMMSKACADLLKTLARTSARVLIAGKGASGKTTLLRAFLGHVPITKRLLVCESDNELYLDHENMVVQRVRKGRYHSEAVTLKELVQDGLTMSLDAYCVGEITGNEAWDFIRAGYTDHGIYGTIHAVGCRDTFFRLLTMMEEVVQVYSERTLESILSRSLDIVIYIRGFKVEEIVQIDGIDEAGGIRLCRLYSQDSPETNKPVGPLKEEYDVQYTIPKAHQLHQWTGFTVFDASDGEIREEHQTEQVS